MPSCPSLSVFHDTDSIRGISLSYSSLQRHLQSPPPPSVTILRLLQSRREMYATEVLGNFSVCRETSQSMADTISCVKNSSFLRPISYVTSISMKIGGASTFCRCSAESKSVGGDIFSVTSSNKCDVDYLGESTKGDLNVKLEHLEAFGKIPIFDFPFLAPLFAV